MINIILTALNAFRIVLRKVVSFCLQLEDSEFAKAAAVKARQAVEAELQECQIQLEEATRAKNEVGLNIFFEQFKLFTLTKIMHAVIFI